MRGSNALHYVGFRGDEYGRAQRVFGPPDFVHQRWDLRARREIAPGDTILFATGPHEQSPADRNGPDLNEALPA